MRGNFRLRTLAIATALVAAIGAATFAGGPLRIYDPATRTPFTWRDGLVNVYTDLGPLRILSNEVADAWVQNGVNQWNNVPTSSFTATLAGDFASIGLPDITSANALSVLQAWNGGGLHIVYDTNGSIMQSVLGLPSSVVGVTSIEWIYTGEPHFAEAWIVMNGNAVQTSDTTGARYAGVFTHEMGHAWGLGHSQTNGQMLFFDPSKGPAGCATPYAGTPAIAQIETMYPFISLSATGTGVAMSSVEMLDDRVSLSNLYPEAGWPGAYATITGKINVGTIPPVGNGGHLTEYTGANVIARNVANPFGDAISALSGDYTQGKAGPDGVYTFNGLTPGAEYAVYVDGIVSGGFSTPYWVILPGPEEWYNGSRESGNGETDPRCEYEPVMASGVSTADITFNKVKGAPVLVEIPYFNAVTDLAPDGQMATGVVVNGPAYKWTPSGGAENMGGFMTAGNASLSDDGLHFTAMTKDPNGKSVAAIWAGGTTWTSLGGLPGALYCDQSFSSSSDMSGDGSKVVGLAYAAGQACRNPRAFVWDAVNGMQELQKINGGRTSRANGISGDGHTIVGFDEHPTGYRLGVRWVDGVEYNFTPNQADTSTWVGEASASTWDGSMVVGGNRQTSSGNRGWLWKASDNSVTTIHGPVGFERSFLSDLTDDGNLIVGFGQQSVGFDRRAMIWSPSLGSITLTDFLGVQGVFAPDWIIATTIAVDAAGKTQGGWANTRFGQLAFVVQNPKAVVCHASPGNPGKQETIDVTFPESLTEHVGHGDTLGICQNGM